MKPEDRQDAPRPAGRDTDAARAAWLAAIVELSTDAIYAGTLDGTVTYWGTGAEETYGYAAAEITGSSASVLYPHGRGGEFPEILARLAGGERIEHFESTRLRKDGTVIDVSVSVTPVRDAADQVTGFATIGRDITAQVRAADQIRAYQEQASRAQRMETAGHLAAGIAHDFNNMLGAIAGLAGLIKDSTDPRTSSDDAQQILAAVDRASTLTGELLIIGGRTTARLQHTGLNAVITAARPLLQASLGPSITLTVDMGADLPAVWADPGQVELALLNLAVNARDAMPDGGTLTITTASARQDGTRPGRYAQLTVTDTGTGMTPEAADRAFEPYYTTKGPGHGTGLGLSTVHGIVTQTGGTITLTSQPDAGTTFRILIPAAPAIPAQAPARSPAAQPAEAQVIGTPPAGTILIADDEPAILRTTARTLQRSGYITLEAATGFQALEILAANDVQLLLTDSLVPGMTGAALADRARQIRPGLPVLHMSGYVPPADPSHQATFIHKPFTTEQLLTKILALLQPQP
jgi:PAS domain S-box-containing protein